MATTTNYGWTTPDDTALVKDGAAAIRSLGSAIDTTTKNLNPGTTNGDIDYYATGTTKSRVAIGSSGQCLTVSAGIPSWQPSATSVLTTTGDLLFASAANTLARRAIGSTGDVLTVSGGLPTWAAPASGGMTLISTTTFNGTPTTVLSSIPATYNDLRIVIRNALPATDSSSLTLRLNNDSTASRHSALTTDSTNNNANALTFSSTGLAIIAGGLDNGVSNSLFVIDIPDYANTATWKMCRFLSLGTDATTTTNYTLRSGVGFYNQTGAISSLGFLFSSGNATSGSILLYGVK